MLAFESSAEEHTYINRYKVDFVYQGIEYQILSEENRTVAVCQSYDIDGVENISRLNNFDYSVESFDITSTGICGPATVIPDTVYDEDGVGYTVTALADGALDYLSMNMLILPSSLKSLNGGIVSIKGMTTLYLPDGLKSINGIYSCKDLKSIYIPLAVESIESRSFYNCGFESVYLPPSIKTMEDRVMTFCENLKFVELSELESIGPSCLSNCKSLEWVCIPETLSSMGEGCFNDCESLQRVSLPWSEIQMSGCFNACPAITEIDILAADPYPFPEKCFNDVDRDKCRLVVPAESVEKYRNADGWKDFYLINGINNENSVPLQSQSNHLNFHAIADDGGLYIDNPSESVISIYTLRGDLVDTIKNKGRYFISLPPDIYLVATGSQSLKVTIK